MALGRVKGPAIALMITAILGIICQAVGLANHLLGAGALPAQQQAQLPAFVGLLLGPLGTILCVVGILMGVVVLLGALKMKKLEGRALALTASILAMVPGLSPCCVLGLPFGIWALVVLSKPEVKTAFH
jgi:hypothetical protein